MPQLRRQVKSSLLKSVPHRVEPESQPLQEVASEDYERDPESSLSEDSDNDRKADIPTWNKSITVRQVAASRRPIISSKSKLPPRQDAAPLLRQKPASRSRHEARPATTGEKRSRTGERVKWSDGSDIDDDDLVIAQPIPAPARLKTSSNDAELEKFLFSSGTRASQTKYTSSRSTTPNIHADSSKPAAPVRNQKKDSVPAFRQPTGYAVPSKLNDGPSFVKPSSGASLLQETSQNIAKFKRPRTPPFSSHDHDPGCMSSPLTLATSPLSSPPPSSVLDENDFITSPSSLSSSTTSRTLPCPICQEPVERTFHNDFMADLGRDRMRVKDKMRFCDLHNAAKARENWDKAEYPSIDWTALPQRLDRMNKVVTDILRRRIHSTYRTALRRAVADDKVNYRHALRNPEAKANHPLTKVVDDVISSPSSGAEPMTISLASSQADEPDFNASISTGYYGPRGSRVILDHIMSSSEISQTLREVSADEELFRRVGIPYFLQVVIVPEIAWRLIREDMGLGGERSKKKRRTYDDDPEEGEIRAKEILLESKAAGDLINGEDEEDVTETAAPYLGAEWVELSD